MNLLRKTNCIVFNFSQNLVQDRLSGLAGYGNTRHFQTITFRWMMLRDSKWSKTLQFSINLYTLSLRRLKHLTFIKTRTTCIQSKLDAGCLTHGALTLGGPHHLCERLLYVFMSVFDVFDIDSKRATFIEHRYIWAFFARWFLLSGYLLTSVPSGQLSSKVGQTVTNARNRLEGEII